MTGMNHFAHLVLARPTVASTVGNLLGDFARGVDTDSLPPRVRAGLLDRAVELVFKRDMKRRMAALVKEALSID